MLVFNLQKFFFFFLLLFFFIILLVSQSPFKSREKTQAKKKPCQKDDRRLGNRWQDHQDDYKVHFQTNNTEYIMFTL